jgi:4-oxalocrotonate tautomerase family enzyme
MPVIQIYMYKGRRKEQKKRLVKTITKTFEEVANIKPESLHILTHDTENLGTQGTLVSDLPSRQPAREGFYNRSGR